MSTRSIPLIDVRLMLYLQVHRLVVVDEQDVVKGIVSLSDILQALVLTDEHCGTYSYMAMSWFGAITHSCQQCSKHGVSFLLFFPQPQPERLRLQKGCACLKGGQNK